METKIQGIVLKKIPYADSNYILSVFTQTEGLQSYFISKKHNKNYPEGSLLNFIAKKHTKQKIPRIQEIEWNYMYKQNFMRISYHCTLSFCIDLLRETIQFTEAHKDLYEFTRLALIHLDNLSDSTIKHIPIFFSLHMLILLGFQITPEQIKASPLNTAIQNNIIYYTNLNTLALITLTRNERTQLLHYILEHYQEYVPQFKYPKSIDIIKRILS